VEPVSVDRTAERSSTIADQGIFARKFGNDAEDGYSRNPDMAAPSLELPTLNPSKSTVLYRSEETVTGEEDRQLRNLLFSCFSYNPIFLARRYLRKRPGHRWMVSDTEGEIVAHAALHEKIIGTETGDLLIGGIAEVCVASPHRGRGIARDLLSSMDQWLKARDIPFAMLFGEPRVYTSSGYVPIQNDLRTENWLGQPWNPFRGTPMIKSHSPTPWPSGMIDLRGPTF
jgi:GNAT superfamily N-acetyltransferase